jgi:hypothetical protein
MAEPGGFPKHIIKISPTLLLYQKRQYFVIHVIHVIL